MSYYPGLDEKWMALKEWIDLKREHGSDTDLFVKVFTDILDIHISNAAGLPVDKELELREPDDLDQIRFLRPEGPRVLEMQLSEEELEDRILGAWLGRCAGCMLGVPVEGFSREDIRSAATALEEPYPLRDYWRRMPKTTWFLNTYNGLPYRRFLRDEIQYVMPDDDLLYTVLGLLILEQYGPIFSSEDVGEAWLRWVPFACTAEKHALDNLRAGLKPPKTALVNNPDSEYLGADIRSDPWGYAAPGLPEYAAEMAWRDARVSHIRNGIYGAMYYAAVISAAIVTGDIRQSLRIGLTEIPAECRLSIALRKTLEICEKQNNYDKVLDYIFNKNTGMHVGHTINNTALVVAGLELGRDDFELIITQVVMAGMDTDCNGATAGSIAGAAWGAEKLPEKWVRPLGKVHRSYLNDHFTWDNNDIADRFTKIALEIRNQKGG